MPQQCPPSTKIQFLHKQQPKHHPGFKIEGAQFSTAKASSSTRHSQNHHSREFSEGVPPGYSNYGRLGSKGEHFITRKDSDKNFY